jgi:hypothetical protein
VKFENAPWGVIRRSDAATEIWASGSAGSMPVAGSKYTDTTSAASGAKSNFITTRCVPPLNVSSVARSSPPPATGTIDEPLGVVTRSDRSFTPAK